MNNYGEPVYDNSKTLIGYKISDNKFASVETYYNTDNLLCNKVSIRELNEKEFSLQDNALIH